MASVIRTILHPQSDVQTRFRLDSPGVKAERGIRVELYAAQVHPQMDTDNMPMPGAQPIQFIASDLALTATMRRERGEDITTDDVTLDMEITHEHDAPED